MEPRLKYKITRAIQQHCYYIVWDVTEAKCILVTAVCVCVWRSVLYYCTDPEVTWGNGRGCPLVVHCWADLQSVHRFRCYDNSTEREMSASACIRYVPGCELLVGQAKLVESQDYYYVAVVSKCFSLECFNTCLLLWQRFWNYS